MNVLFLYRLLSTSSIVQITLQGMIGKGSFGMVYAGRWRGQQVAVKALAISSTDEVTCFMRELQALSAVQHPNVVRLLGKTWEGRAMDQQRFTATKRTRLVPNHCYLTLTSIIQGFVGRCA